MRGFWRLWYAHTPSAVRREGTGLILAALLIGGLVETAAAQGNAKFRQTGLSRDEQKQYVDDLSSARMMDLDRSRLDRGARRRTTDSKLDTPTPEMKKLRSLLDDFLGEAGQLQSVLSNESEQNRSLRTLLNDAFDVTAQATNLLKNAELENDQHAVVADVQSLDAAWGSLEYRLQGQRRLSKEAQDHIKNLHDIDHDIRHVVDIGQQVNYRDLSAKAVALATYLTDLTEDIPIALGKSTQEGRAQLTDTNRALQQAQTIADLADEKADMQSIVDEYKTFQQLWYPQAAGLQSKNREYLERSLRRIAQTDGEIGQLLLMPQRYDKTQVVYLTNALRKNIDDFFDNTTLKQLTRLESANQTLAAADEFYGVCQHFADTVNHQDDYNHIVDSFRELEQADRNFLKVFGGIEDADAAASLEKISQTFNALRTSLQVNREDFSRQTANQLAAKIENLTERIDTTVRAWLAHDRQSFTQDCQDDTDALVQAAADLHHKITAGENMQQIRADTEHVYQLWRRVYNYMVKCQTEDRAALGRSASQLTPALVELRTLVAQ